MARWVRIRKADIDAELRKTFERYGVNTLQLMLAGNPGNFRHQGKYQDLLNFQDDLLPWLTEQHDWAEMRETWLVAMEIAITVLVAIEVILSAMALFYPSSCL